jgi:AraC family transcriptional regulator of adaptative response/methylated-DNA-[protein]-cysteine methyltransferase
MNQNFCKTLTSSTFETPLGSMIAIADNAALYLLEFVDCRGLEREMKRLSLHTKSTIIPGSTAPIESIKTELTLYFNGTLKEFKTPIHTLGTSFQKSVWSALQNIPYGQTKSYAEQAQTIGNKSAFRAVANANGANQLAIIIPCHRIINSNGKLGGYGGGVDRKQWLLNFERQHHDQ